LSTKFFKEKKQMKKKILYGGMILVMLIGMFGVMSPGGVQTVQAAAGWNDARSGVTDTSLPFFSTLNLSTANGSADGNFGGCTLAPAFGAYQTHLLVPAEGHGKFLRVRLEATGGNMQDAAWAVRISNATLAGYPELGCALAPASGVVDLVVAVPEDTDVLITVASHGIFTPTAALFNSMIVSGDNPGGGLIIDMTADAGDMALRTVEATNQADEGTDIFYIGENFGMYTFLDVPVGTYNIGVQDQTANAEFAAYYPDVEVPALGFIPMTPDADSLIPLEVLVRNMGDVPFNVDNVVVTPNYFGLNSDLEVGPTNVGTEAVGQKTFRMNFNPPTYDYKWDIGVLYESTSEIIFFYEKDFNPVAGTLIFWGLAKVPAQVDLCANAGYDAGGLTLNPDGQLEPRDFKFIPGSSLNCDEGYAGKAIFLSSNEFGPKPYEVSDLFLEEEGWTYYFEPLGGTTWNLAPLDLLTGDPSAAYVIGDVPFETGPVPNATSQEEYVLPLADGEVSLMREPWTDQFGNTLVKVQYLDEDEEVVEVVEVMPVYRLTNATDYLLDEWELLANDWEITDLGPITEVGRYMFVRELEHGDLTDVGDGEAGFFSPEQPDLFAISPADTTMFGHWSWSWVMAMYEYDFTNGVDGVNYGVEQNVSRGQMAAFLGRVMEAYGLAPLGLSEEFDDVFADDYYHDAVMLLRDYGITNGVGNNLYDPEAEVSREQMAKFIEETFRAIQAYTGAIDHWNPSFEISPTGVIFEDVGLDNFFVSYIEELAWDGLTDGCGRDGLNISYCPKAPVLRSEMAKFIMSAVQLDEDTQSFWPILAPEK